MFIISRHTYNVTYYVTSWLSHESRLYHILLIIELSHFDYQ
nr:MAG TPA: hypothetical protein [Caudoviricetes sp.]